MKIIIKSINYKNNERTAVLYDSGHGEVWIYSEQDGWTSFIEAYEQELLKFEKRNNETESIGNLSKIQHPTKKKKQTIKLIASIVIFCAVAVCIAVNPIRENILYWLYYKPLYSLFSNYLYFPFCLYIISWLLFAGLFVVLLSPLWSYSKKMDKKWQKNRKIGYVVVMIIMAGGTFVLVKNACNDFKIIRKESYWVAEYEIGKLERYVTKGKGVTIKYYLNSKSGLKNERININLYQYKELFELQKQLQNNNQVIKIYYLPNTQRMLKYEY